MKSLVTALVVALFGLGFAWLASDGSMTAHGLPIFVICALAAYAINWIAFIPAAITQSETYYDLIGSVTFLSLIALATWLAAPLDTRGMIAAAMVVIWTSRLGLYLFSRIRASEHGDQRFDKIKTKPTRFFVAWTFQAVWAIVTASAAILAISASNRVEPDVFLIIGAIIWVVAFVIEVIADRQKAAFRADPANKGEFITSGLWSWSQHPNYFGEIMMWVGIVVIAWPTLSGWAYLVLLSPLLILLLLTKISGINLLREAGEKKWGDRADYRAYRERTSTLIPMPPKK